MLHLHPCITSMQVDGYSLDAQKDKLHKYADYQDMSITGEYSDEGKSGKSVEGRPQFQQMLGDIETGNEAEVIRIIYDKYANTSMGIARNIPMAVITKITFTMPASTELL